MRKLIPWIFFASAALGCMPEVVRVPAICTNAPYCVPPEEKGDPLTSRDPARLRAFLKRNAESTVFVRSATYREKDGIQYRRATGALIGIKGLALASYHAVSLSEFISVSYRRMKADGAIAVWREAPAEIVAFSREKDIALLRIKENALMPPSFPLRRGPPAKGDVDWFFGAETIWGKTRLTDTNVFSGSLTRSFITADARMTDVDAGAPLVNDCGELVGILLFDNGKGVIYGLPIDEIFTALDLKMQDLY